MLALTKKTDYALIALTQLARRGGELMSAREVSRLSRVPLPVMTNILKVLAHAGIVESERGANGGYVLNRAAASVNLHELIAAIEGPFHFVQCSSGGDESSERGECTLQSSCPIRKPAYRIQGRLRDFLRSVTLAELLDDEPQPVGVSVEGQLRLRRA